jgi:CRP-like cAMP-binding protein
MDKSRIKPQAFLSKVALFNAMRACELDRIAPHLNLTPEHFSRIMADLSARKLIAFLGRRIDILDATALRRCAA